MHFLAAFIGGWEMVMILAVVLMLFVARGPGLMDRVSAEDRERMGRELMWIVIGVAAFYASIEQRDNPELRGKPVIVGSPPTQRGVVCAASYEARTFGLRSALPSVTAGRLCPSGVFIRPNMEKYREESRRIMEIVARSGATIEQMSVDEAYMDLSAFFQGQNADESLRPALPAAREIKQQIRVERQLTASIGIASNKLLADVRGSD
jgi:DNA polymerase-4